MKKKVLSLMLTLAMTATLFAGCGGSDDASNDNAGTANTEVTTGGDEVAATGSVYMLNFKPEVDQQWKDLAAIYTEKTGVQVDILTAAGPSTPCRPWNLMWSRSLR